MTDDLVLYDIADRVATITLHRPDAMNAMTLDMGAQLVAAFERAEADDGVRAAVLTGAGKAFCAGDDVKEAWQPEALARGLAPLKRAIPKTTPETTHILEFEKPLIAAVNGVAVGIGLDLALVADIRLANQYARFAALYVNFNLVADFASMRRLPQLIGPSRAAELLFTGDTVDAAQAERIGLVSRVVDAGELPGAAHELAARIAHKPPAALRAMKAGLAKGTGMSAPDLLPLGEYISRSLVALFATNDHREAVAAFMEGREPDFNGT